MDNTIMHTMLFDFYGDLLTDRQKEFYDLYYNEDLSLAEIAENYGITRQGVRDVIVRAEAYLTEVEDKTRLIRRFHEMRRQIAAIDSVADQLVAFSREKGRDAQLEKLVNELKQMTEQLGKE